MQGHPSGRSRRAHRAPFADKREYLEQYRRDWAGWLDAERAVVGPRRVTISSPSSRAWFEPLLVAAPITSAGVAGQRRASTSAIPTPTCASTSSSRRCGAWSGEPYVYKIDVDRALIETLVDDHVEDWVNSLFLSCRFTAHRDGPFNEFVLTFFKALSPERIAYVEQCHQRGARSAPTSSSNATAGASNAGVRTARPTSRRFGEIDDGVLTCSLHHWRFDLETGRVPHERRPPSPLRARDARVTPRARIDAVTDERRVQPRRAVRDRPRRARSASTASCSASRLDREINPPDELSAQLLGLTPPLGMTASYLVRDGLVLELLHFAAPGQTQPYEPRSMNEPGLTHISLSVDDVDEVLARVRRVTAATVIADSNIGAGVFIKDPDGQLVELLPMEYRRRLDEAQQS